MVVGEEHGTENKYVMIYFQTVERVAKRVEQEILATLSPSFGGGLV